MSKLIEYYKQQRDFLKQRFEAEKTGDQTLFTERSKLLKPLIESQKETSKSIQDKIATSQDTISNVLVPFTRALEKRNDQLETLQDLPYVVSGPIYSELLVSASYNAWTVVVMVTD